MLNHHGGRAGPSASGSAARFLAKARDHRMAGRGERARDTLNRVLGKEPNHPEAHYELGQLLATSAPDRAITHFVTALRGAPDNPIYWFALATALLALERTAEARAILERFKGQGFGDKAQAPKSAFIEQTYALALARYELGKFTEAEALLDLVILLDEDHANATFLAGAVAARTNRSDLAFDLISIAILRDPGNALYFSGLSTVLCDRGDKVGALSALEKALTLDPGSASTHSNIASAYHRVGRYAESLWHADQAIALDPKIAGVHVNRGVTLMVLGRHAEAVEAFDQALVLDPSKLFVASNRLFCKLYDANVPVEEYAAEAIAYGRQHADPLLRKRPFANDRDPDRPLRVGFVSGDFCSHAVVHFIEPFLRALDRNSLTLLSYMTHANEDAVSERLRTQFDTWHNIANMDDDAAADLIESEAVDILIDLAGHSAGNRLMLFARKPAPIQITWIGHPGTTGLSAIDYRLTDQYLDPPGVSEALHAERLWRLPRVAATYSRADVLPPVRARAPSEDSGFITFGCLNRLTKVCDAALKTWARILNAVPDAKLFMVVGGVEAPEVRKALDDRLARAGMPLDRVIFQPRVETGYHELYHQVDIALDPYPYNGGTTSFDTLSMGVPFISLRGGHAAARTGASILHVIGLPELIADDEDAYVNIARDLARAPDRLKAIRTGLRERLFSSPVMDHSGVAAEVTTAFRSMWAEWLDGSAG